MERLIAEKKNVLGLALTPRVKSTQKWPATRPVLVLPPSRSTWFECATSCSFTLIVPSKVWFSETTHAKALSRTLQ